MTSKQEFPVRVSKGTGDDKVTRTAHSPIALAQLQTEGFKIEGERRSASAKKSAGKSAGKSADQK